MGSNAADSSRRGLAEYGWKTKCCGGKLNIIIRACLNLAVIVVCVFSFDICLRQNQTNNLDRSIDDVLEHFVYLPKQSPANAADIPFFLSTRLADATVGPGAENIVQEETNFFGNNDPVQVMTRYENQAAELASEYEENMIRF